MYIPYNCSLVMSVPLVALLLLLTTAQPYIATDHFRLRCGSSSPSTTTSNQRWDGDEGSKFVPPNIATNSFSSTPYHPDPSASETPYTTARIFNASSFTYTFPVSQGPKFLRLYFFPATYSDLNANQSFFSVSSNGYSLLTNFSASLTASFLKASSFSKEFIIYVKDSQILDVTFKPSPNSYAFINGIEIVSMPENLYYNGSNVKPIGQNSGPPIDDYTALENIYRLNVGGMPIQRADDTGMYRSWDQDEDYIFGGEIGVTPSSNILIIYTLETPNYTAPEPVYQTQRSMGNNSRYYNLTWILPVDSGFYYLLRLHFCNIIPQYTRRGQVIFRIFIHNQTAEEEADLFFWTPGSGYALHRDYIVFVNSPDGQGGKQDLWLALQPNNMAAEVYPDGFLNGLEVFKLNMTGNLASPNPEPTSTPTPATPASPGKVNKKKSPIAMMIGGVGGGLLLLSILVIIIYRKRRQAKNYTIADDKSSYGPTFSESKSTKSSRSTLPSDRCRRFTLAEMKEATNEFNDNFIIGNGGFGKVYKGYLDTQPTTTVAIKRLNSSSSQGVHEFETEITMLSNLRHVKLVSLIGFCKDEGEMILVYDYMAHGTLREHLYKTSNPPLSWKRRLRICIGAAEGLHYLHTGAKHVIIHRDVKSTNILLDENWVAKVSDFGLSKLGPRDQLQNYVSTVVKGSIGYVDPEYYRSRQLNDKSDVYSFGVVLLEVLCARPAMIPGLPKEQVSLAAWGKYCYRKGTLDRIIDPKLKGKIAPECLRKFTEVANSCLRDEGTQRPAMEEVVYGLELALQLQESAEKLVGDQVMSENQELPFLMQGEPTTTDEDMFTGSSAIKNGTSSISRSFDGFKSETVFSEMLTPTGR